MTSEFLLNELTIEITKKCPMQCLICSSEGGVESQSELTYNELCEVVDDAVKLGAQIISLSGGEPLESPYVLDFIRYAKNKGLKIFLYTCGNVKKDGTVVSINSEIFQELKEISVDKIIFSIHGPNAKIHENITQVKGSFNNLVNSIQIAKEYVKNIELHFVPVKPNFPYLIDTIQFAMELGISQVSILRFVPQGRGSLNREILELTLQEMQELKVICERATLIKNVNIRYGAPFNCFNINKQAICSAGIDKAVIRPDGLVFPCVSMKKVLDNKFNDDIHTSSLAHIWYQSVLMKKIRELLNNRSLCSNCINLSCSNGGCITQKIIDIHRNEGTLKEPYCITSQLFFVGENESDIKIKV